MRWSLSFFALFLVISQLLLPYDSFRLSIPTNVMSRTWRSTSLQQRATASNDLVSQYVSIKKIVLPSNTQITTFTPKGWLYRSLTQHKHGISHIVYIPSIVSKVYVDVTEAFWYLDDSFLSLLCDRGYVIHILEPTLHLEHSPLPRIDEVIHHVLHRYDVIGRNLALIGHELSSIHVLNYLTEVALPMSPQRVDIGAVILLDNAPIHALYSFQGKRNLWKRYIEPIRCLMEARVIDFQGKKIVKVLSKSQEKKRSKQLER